MSIERLDGFTSDGGGHVIPGEPIDGDVVRIDGRIEQRFYVPPAPVPAAIVISKRVFIETASAALGPNGQGRAALGTILRGMATSLDDEIYVVAQRWDSAETLDKSQVATLTAILASKGIMTAQQRTTVLNAWPTA